jgi:peptidoglycan/LPS O-acetylase OafA/YrhL
MFVVSSHIVRAYIPRYLYPADEMDGTPRLFQRPFFRIIACGPFWISIFFLLSGYVCAIKPLRLSAAGQADEARRVIASSAFRRLSRIGVPVLAGTLFPWALVQTGVFNIAPEVEIEKAWLSYTRPGYRQWFWPAVREPFLQFVPPPRRSRMKLMIIV